MNGCYCYQLKTKKKRQHSTDEHIKNNRKKNMKIQIKLTVELFVVRFIVIAVSDLSIIDVEGNVKEIVPQFVVNGTG